MRAVFVVLMSLVLSACAVWPNWNRQDTYLVHVVLVWLKDSGDESQRQQFLQSARVLQEIPGVLDMRVGRVVPGNRDVVKDDFDVGLVLRFENQEALQAYLKHPLHVATVKDRFMPIMQRYEVMDILHP